MIKHTKYNIFLQSPSVEEFSQLRKKAGWGETNPSIVKRSLENSLFHVTLRENSKLIGMGRVIGDGSMYFYIQDIIVEPNYQRQGLGSQIMHHIEIYLSKVAEKGATIGLLSAKGKEEFYSRYGYIKRPNDELGNGMCKFIL